MSKEECLAEQSHNILAYLIYLYHLIIYNIYPVKPWCAISYSILNTLNSIQETKLRKMVEYTFGWKSSKAG